MAKKGIEMLGFKEAYSMLDGLPLAMKAKALKSVNGAIARKALLRSAPNPYGAKEFTKVLSDPREPTGVQFGIETKAFWFGFLEYGTKLRTRKSGGSTGTMPAKPFFNNYIAGKVNETIKIGKTEYGEFMARYIRRKVKRIL